MPNHSTPIDELREQITLIRANNLFSGMSIAEVRKMPKSDLDKFEAETDEIMAVFHKALEAREDELIKKFQHVVPIRFRDGSRPAYHQGYNDCISRVHENINCHFSLSNNPPKTKEES